MSVEDELRRQRDELLAALIRYVEMPEWDGTPDTSRERLKIKRATRQLINDHKKRNP